MEPRKVPRTLEEAYGLRDASSTPEERDFYQEHVYRLRRESYRRRNIKTRRSARRRDRARAGGLRCYWWAARRTARRLRMDMGGIVERRPLLAFYSLALIITWFFWIPAAASYQFSALSPRTSTVLLIVGGFGPTLSAIILTAIVGGRADVRELLGRLLRWRVGVRWYAAVLLVPPALSLFAVGLYALLGDASPRLFSPVPWYLLPFYFLVILAFVGPLQEEVGWRGYALPVLQAKRSALSSGLIVGLMWAFWHLPLAWAGRIGRPGIPLVLFMLAIVGLSILFVWAYNGTRGSLLVCLLLHASLNTTLRSLPILQTGVPPLAPTLIGVGLLWMVAVAIVVTRGPKHLAGKPTSS